MRRLLAVTFLLTCTGSAAAQGVTDQETLRERARPHVIEAWRLMDAEDFEGAATRFRQAIVIDSRYEDAYYGLGLAHVRMRRYAEAVPLYVKARDLYRAHGDRQFANVRELQRYKADRLKEIDELISGLYSGRGSRQPVYTQSQALRVLQQERRQVEESLARGDGMDIESLVPAYVYLALGSAYFRLGQIADAEREYLAAIHNDPKSGETFNNLAVIYLQTGRYKRADEAARSAERAGYNVHPQLKKDIAAKLQ
jgi:tetratricopeptide (TPR) repeat protein